MLSIRKIGVIGRTYRHLNRYRQILTVLFKYGFGDLVDVLKIEQYLEIGLQMISRKRREQVERLTRSERVRMALEELGPTFIKLGQVLSTRPDLIPVEFVEELSKLQDHVPPFAYAEVAQIIESELGAAPGDIFQHFDETPLAAASIGQVHRARLKDGEEVVVKVQRPGIRKIIEVDLEIMLHLASLMERHIEEFQVNRPVRIVEEFARTLEKEIDYTIEASHIERFGRQFIDDATVYVPKVFRETTTERVLTMEYIDGVKASEIDRIEEEGLDRKIITSRGADLILKQVFDHGFFHADPHPGNIFVLPGNVLCYLDFGMMGSIDRQSREDFADLVHSVVRRDESRAMQALLTLTQYDEEPDTRLLARDLSDFMGQHLYKPLKDLQMEKLLHQLMELISRHRLQIPPDLFLMMKALAIVEGVGLSLDPDFEMINQATPFIQRVKMEQFHPKRVASDIMRSGTELVRLIQEIPGELRELLRQMKRGKVKMEFEHVGLEPMLATHDRTSNRIAFSIVIAALIVGSALIVLSKTPPFLFGIPVIGILGFVAAAVMGMWLLIAILRKGRL
ncbi:MAG: AarF/ABC1/UbiB kinase family protein [Deltaproteobacteria bacterium]|nr:AarF/ABC1/UbiB kinase family protein [Deltaproteobacteria bacterium]MBW1796466.1 AarF/ABC1/UbiB kinase family protein [Deltaproteobacteria bacterium]